MYKIASMILFLFLIACSENSTGSNNDDDGTNNNNNESAPGFTLESLDHGSISLSDYEGEVVVMFFLGYICPRCIGEGPSVESQLHQGYMGQKVQVLGLDVWNGTRSQLANNFKIPTGASYPLLLEASGVGNIYGVSYDSIVIVDQDQKIVYKKRRVNISEIKGVIDGLLQ